MNIDKFIVITLFCNAMIIIAIMIDNSLSSLPDITQFVIQLPLLTYVIGFCGNYVKTFIHNYRGRFGQNICDHDIDMVMMISLVLSFFVSPGFLISMSNLYEIYNIWYDIFDNINKAI